ncbi:MAG TPA: tRNA (guanine-N7)-methyltransferase [Polyangiaceae bacterium]|nr:tRNA (guanine-N7)-methyltransferase [Polyangiaceae bacterium]
MGPYENAPRLPEGTALRPGLLLEGAECVELEIGPGRGWFMIERLGAVPQVGMIGLEIRRKWATIVDERLRVRGYGRRGRVFAEDAGAALSRFEPATLAAAFIHFPDPWWKKRHQKRRVVTRALLQELARVIRAGGELFMQTDVAERALDFEELVESVPEFEPWQPSGPRVDENPYQARSPRERRAIEDGLPVVRLRYRRRSVEDQTAEPV